ncbi:type VII secretion system-associated protein [Solihabitans fulvus]|uniref:Type VII secretion system-associated protein n=1 Tax=Solihabitans fulvus TaxID=1892852 RepID=A0A5B2XM80_9PSEU|nr:type VII secretion system-associated protein [Solihabitans fulvus]KAA2264235.1 type VII secretion system-associated protein [Solihabitans fulvus]
MTEPVARQGRREEWLFLPDPRWQPAEDGPPPLWAVVGGWRLDGAGRPGLFQPNPEYRPADEAVPTDPIDAVLRLVAGGEAAPEAAVAALCAAFVEVAYDEVGSPIVALAPDGVPCVLVVTAAAHRAWVAAAAWRQLTAAELVELVPAGADILVNPGGPAAMRLLTTNFTESLS